jgi:hypothetical protein
VYVRTYPRKFKPGALFRRPRPRTVLVGRCDLLDGLSKLGLFCSSHAAATKTTMGVFGFASRPHFDVEM